MMVSPKEIQKMFDLHQLTDLGGCSRYGYIYTTSRTFRTLIGFFSFLIFFVFFLGNMRCLVAEDKDRLKDNGTGKTEKSLASAWGDNGVHPSQALIAKPAQR
jgi:hypothetical protein